MNQPTIPLGLWKSRYSYPSSGRKGMFDGEHSVRLLHEHNHYIFESLPKGNKSYLMVRLSITEDNVVTGSWQEQTDPDGYYQGAVYYGAIQLTISPDGKKMSGKWVGFGKDMDVNVGPWEFTYQGPLQPEE